MGGEAKAVRAKKGSEIPYYCTSEHICLLIQRVLLDTWNFVEDLELSLMTNIVLSGGRVTETLANDIEQELNTKLLLSSISNSSLSKFLDMNKNSSGLVFKVYGSDSPRMTPLQGGLLFSKLSHIYQHFITPTENTKEAEYWEKKDALQYYDKELSVTHKQHSLSEELEKLSPELAAIDPCTQWQFEDEKKGWQNYTKKINEQIQTAYKKKKKSLMIKLPAPSKRAFTVHFENMTETNKNTNKKRSVRKVAPK